MNCFKKEYQEKLRQQQDVYDLILDGNYIATGLAGCEPVAFLKNLHMMADRINRVTVSHSLDRMSYEFHEKPYSQKFDTVSFFLMESARKGVKNGDIGYIPGNLHDAATREIACNQIDVFVCAVCPMDDMGYFRCSLSCIAETAYVAAAKKVILEVVDQMPVIYGDNVIHISDVDAIYECSRSVPTIESPPLTEEDKAIGAFVASLVEDGSTIQLGIGAIPDAIAKALLEKKDLGIHTEMITNSVADLVEKGVVTGKRKTLHHAKIIGTFALGNQRLYNLMQKNPAFSIKPGAYVNDSSVIAKNDNMVSINSAISVDFTGQIASESIGPVQYSGTGGQSDTAIGAIHSKGGKSIIALRSTAKNGELSTITPFLPLGSIVTLSRNNIDYVVTEYGIAYLKSRSTMERAQSLIAIAHPKFRAELMEQAKEYGYVK